MSFRRFFGCVFFSILLAFLTISPSGSTSQNTSLQETALIAGRNVNMVSGTTLPGGDPWLQRQNEPSIAVSTRNPLHLLAGANDYRTVDMAASEGELPGNLANSPIAAGDAWLGVFQSMDRGESWTSTMLPGYPQGGGGSPLYGYNAAADPVVRAGTNGIFYYAGIVFKREDGQNKDSALFLARYIDNNNTDGTPPIKYIDARIIDSVTNASGQFIDKPWIAVDIPNANQTVPVSAPEVPAQSIAANSVYIAYTVFSWSAAANTLEGKILFRSSEDNGLTWSSAVEVSSESDLNQGAVIGVDPGTPKKLYVAWRRFIKGSQTNAIMVAASNDGGKRFQKAVQIASITPFDQGSSGATFRSNSYPAMAIDDKGYIHVAWTARGFGPSNDSRIVISSSNNGNSWSTPRAVDNHSGRGHQFMPSLVYTGGKLMMAWYDARNDVSGAFTDYMDESTSGTLRHTIDVRTTTASPGSSPSFGASIQVSRYLFALVDNTRTGDTQEIYQVQFNPVNYPLFKGGTQPFHGDYVDLAPSPMFVLKNKKWQFNTDASSTPIYHVAWTDNRDVRPPANNIWTNYTPPTSFQPGNFPSPAFGACDPVTAGMRNQNIYTAAVTEGITIGTPRNAKPLGGLGTYSKGQIPRTFIVFVKNATSEVKSFRFAIVSPPTGGTASFLEFQSLSSLDVSVAPNSEVARSVFVTSTSQTASVTIQVTEIFYPGGNTITGGFSGSVVLNPDDSNPSIPSGDSLATEEYFNPNIINPNIINPNIINPNIINWNYANPNIINPNIINPNIINPNIINPNIINPNIINPNIINPNIINPNIINPNIINPNIINPNIINTSISDPSSMTAADIIWEVENKGNTYSTYTVRTMTSASIPAGLDTHLFIYRIHYTPQTGGDDCRLKQEPHFELVASIPNPNIINPNIINPNIINPNIINPDIQNATFYIGPGESAIVDLRIIDPNIPGTRIMATGQAFSVADFVKTIDFAATAHNVDTVNVAEEKTVPSFAATELMIGTSAQLPDAKIGTLYSLTLSASGPGGSSATYTWKLNSGDLPPGLLLSSNGVISGTPQPATGVTYPFTYHFVLEVTDGSLADSEEFFLTIYSTPTPPALSISTASPLPNAIVDSFYGKALEAVGGTWPRSWNVVSGSLPPGLTFDTAGAISGIPTTTGTYSFTLQVTDSSAPVQTASEAFNLTVIQNQGSVTISGKCYSVLGTGLPGVLMRGLPDEPRTDANGIYSAEVPYGWSGTVTPFIVGCAFAPVSRTYASITTNQTSPYTDYNAVVGAANKLAFGVQPSATAVGATITPAVTVKIQDAAGNLITTARNVVTISIGTNPGSGTLSGTLSKAAVAGVATFNDLSINKAGTGYTLSASSAGLVGATSTPFNITVSYAISGTVTLGGLPLQGVLMAGLPGNPRTDTNGFYTAAVPAGWSGTVTPTLPGFSFNPPNRNYSSVTSDQTNQGYTSNYVGGQDDVFEPNNDYDHAATITPGTYSDLVLKDEDWYRIYVSAADIGKILKVHIKGTSYPDPSIRKDLDFYIIDGSKRLLSYNYSGTDDEIIYLTDLTEGWYYIGHIYIEKPGAVYSMTVEIGTNFGIGFISGRVTDDLGNGIENINIELYRNPNDWNVSFPMITTGPGGYYKIGYTPGNYLVRFNLYNFYHRDPWILDPNYIGKQYPGMVQIVAGSTVTGIDAQLIPGGVITGQLTDPAGNPITNATNANIQVFASDNTRVSLAYPDQNGNYIADRIPRTGNYKIRFASPSNTDYGVKWYGTSYSFEEGLPVPVQTGATTSGINGQFEAGGFVEGHVTDGSGTPIEGVQVIAYDVAGISLSSSVTNANGDYTIPRLPGGPLKIFFNAATASGNYVSEYYSDKLTIGEADPVPVQPGQTTSGIDAQLAAGGAITGHVIDSQGNALPSVSVTCFDTNSERFYGATGDASGNYAVRLLPPGTYKLRFRATTENYPPKWYNARNSFALGDVVTVNAGATVTGINGQLTDSGGSISGRVTDGTLGIVDVWVTVRDSTKQTNVAAIATLADGTYTISCIPAGEVKVYFNTDLPFLNYVSEYYNDRSTFATAHSVPVTLGQTTSGIDSVLSAGPPLSITTASLPNGEMGVPYSTSLQASGGREFYYWSVISGGLPNGLALSSKGVISGTPTGLGTFAFEVRVTDSTSPQQTTTRNCSLTIGNYTGSGYLISGTVTLGSLPLQGVLMAGLPGNPRTDTNGFYTAAEPAGWSGTVTPFLIGYNFSPVSRSYSSITTNQSGQNYNAIAGAASKLAFKVQPSDTAAGVVITPAVTVEIQDATGNLVTTATDTVAVAIQNNPGGGTLSGTLSKPAVGGIATFNDLSINYIGIGYTLSATSGSLTAATSNPFNIFAGIDPSAPRIMPGVYNNLVISDRDVWFKVNVEEGKDLQVSTSNAVAQQMSNDLDIYLYDSAGNLLITAFSDKGDETVFLSNVPAGVYFIRIWGSFVNYTLTVATGDFAIGEITGRVTNSLGNGVQNALVFLYPENDSSWTALIAIAPIDGEGNYKIAHAPGNYKLLFSWDERILVVPDIYVVGQWYSGTTDFASAEIVAIQAGVTNGGKGAVLEDGAAISGQVTTTPGGAPISQVLVKAYNATGGYSSARTDSSGNYTIKHIRILDGIRKVQFDAQSVGNYISEWFNDKTSQSTANPVNIKARETTAYIDAQLAEGGIISGRVTRSSGSGIASVVVNANDLNFNFIRSGSTNADGYYSIPGLPEGSYKVFFNTNSAGYYVPEWYNDKISFNEAVPVSVIVGQTTSDIDAVLAEGGVISGRVTNEAGQGLQNINIWPSDLNGNFFGVGSRTNSTGNYTLPIAAGDYKLYFNTNLVPAYTTEWYDNKPSSSLADQIHVVIGATNTANAVLAAAPTSFTISGTVKVGGVGVVGVVMNGLPGSPVTDASGFYTATVNPGWSGVVTPTLMGYVFTPTSRPYSSISANQVDQDYSATVGVAVKLAFGVQPSHSSPNATITPAVTVEIQDPSGNKITSATNTVTLSIGTNPSGGTLTGTLSMAAVAGVATFNDLKIDAAGTGYTLSAVSSGLTPAASSAFNIIAAGLPAKLGFRVQPTDTPAGAAITPAVTIEIQDAAGNLVASATDTVTIAIQANPGSGALIGTLARAAVGGVATFNDLTISNIGIGYTLSAISGALTGATSNPFTVYTGIDLTATAITPGMPYNLHIGDQNLWYKVVVAGGKDLQVSTSNVVGAYPDVDLFIYDSAGSFLAAAVSSKGDETVYLSNLAAGTYYIRLWSSQVDFTLTVFVDDLPLGEIAGRVLNSVGGAVEKAVVYLYSETDASWNGLYELVATNTSGNYKIAYVPGNYKLQFNFLENIVPSPELYSLPEWYNDSQNHAGATVVPITLGTTNNVLDGVLPDGTAISGRVTIAGGAPATPVTARAYESPTLSRSATTDGAGNYIIKRIPMSVTSRTVYFVPGGTCNGLPEWFNDKPDQASANPVSILPRVTTAGIDAVLAAGGIISGRVTNTSGAGIDKIYVSARNASNVTVKSLYTDAAGYYSLPGLPTGSYRIYFSPSSNYYYIGEWYDNKTNSNDANAISITAGSQISGINAVLSSAGAIGGQVTNSSSAGIYNVNVRVYNLSNSQVASASSNSSGNYTVPGIPPGTYRVYFDTASAGNYVSEWYHNGSIFSAGLDVSVNIDATTPVSEQLDGGGIISGTVTNPTGGGIQNVNVSVRNSSNSTVKSVTTNAGGVYAAQGLPEGSYYIYFDTYNAGNYVSEWNLNRATFNTADPVTVTVGGTTTCDAQLAVGGTISGTVTNGTTGIADVNVSVQDSSISYYQTFKTDASGNYAANRLPTGNFKIWFDTSLTGYYVDEWYNNKTSSNADVIAVTAGNTYAGYNAVLAPAGKITGLVTNSSNGGIYNVSVRIYNLINTQVKSAYTNSSGIYTVTGLPPGEYKLYFDPYSAGNYLTEWYDDKASFTTADQVSVAADLTTSVNAQLASGGIISGLVTNASQGIYNVQVGIYDLNNVWIRSASTNTSGSYSIPGLAPANYKVFFDTRNDGNYISEWYDDKTSFTMADQVSVAIGLTTTANAELAGGGIISGQVTNVSNPPQGIANVSVSIYDLNNIWIRSASTNTSGNYSIQGLATGSYKVNFDTYSAGYYVGEWYNDKTSSSAADLISVTAGETTSGIDAILTLGGAISGLVTDVSNPPQGIANVYVSVYDLNNVQIRSASTNTSGNYSVQGVPAGTYKVYFGTWNAGNYVSEWYDNVASFNEATSVSVTAGATTADINAQLAGGGIISGQVTNLSNPPQGIANVYVSVYDLNNVQIRSASTNTSGNYSVQGVATGSYKIYFDTSSAGYYVGEWYNDKTSFIEATLVSVTASATTSVNAQLASGGIISGLVKNISDTGIFNVQVGIYDLNNIWIRSASTNTSGNYSVQGVPAGTYKVYFGTWNAGNYVSEWYDNVASFNEATSVSVTAGATTADINAQLAGGGIISGHVKNSSNAGIANVNVNIYDLNYYSIRSGQTDGSGNYSVQGVPGGNCKVSFETSQAGNYVSQWYNGKANSNEADQVSVTVGATTSGIDATLAPGGTISGHVKNSSNTGIANVYVNVYDLNYNYLRSGQTDGSGNYSVQGVPAGACKVYFGTSQASYYLPQWFDGKAFFTDANQVSVTAGATTSGIDATLALGGIISGRVINASGQGLQNINIWPSHLDGSFFGVGSGTNNQGNYWLQLPEGNYKIYFNASSAGNYVSEWYNDKTSSSAADSVSVTAGATTADINATLAPAFIIDGQVTAGGVPLAGVVMMGLPGAPTPQTDAQGQYRAMVEAAWSGTVTPTKVGYAFTPPSTTYTPITQNQTTNYSAGVAAAKLAFRQQPSNTEVNATITPAVTVEIQDAWGNLVPTATNTVTLSLSSNPGGATLGGTASKAAVGGVVTFDNLSLDKAGTGYMLRANSGSLTEVDSSLFNIISCSITTPNTPTGTGTGAKGISYSFATGGSTDSLGHTVEYRLDWGDGTFSDWTTSLTASHAWTIVKADPYNDPYQVKAQSRCQAHPSVVSAWSAVKNVSIFNAVTTISGTLMYNGNPITSMPDAQGKPAVFWMLRETNNWVVPISPSYDPATGNFSIPNIPEGNYGLTAYIDAALPTDGNYYPGDYHGYASGIPILPPINPPPHDFNCQKIMHLTAPINNSIAQPWPPPFDNYFSPVLFSWDPVPGASVYKYKVDLYQTAPNQLLQAGFFTDTSSTQASLGFLPSVINQHYQFEVDAYSGLRWLGKFMIVYVSGYGSDYRFRINSGGSAPEINLKQGATNIADGGSYDYGSHVIGTNTDITFTIENTGSGNLTLNGSPIITIAGADASQFSVRQQPSTPVFPSSSTTFIIRFSPTSAGIKTASISISNDDADENPYNLTITGAGSESYSILTTYQTPAGVNIELEGGKGIDLDSSGNIYFTDCYLGGGHGWIYRFDSAGNYLSPAWDLGRMEAIYGFAIDVLHSNEIYYSNQYYISPDLLYKVFRYSGGSWGSNGSGDGQFNVPIALCCDETGYVYVLDKNNHRVQKFTPTGGFVTKWGTQGTADGQFNSPIGIACDGTYIYVSDTGNNRIQVFDTNGGFVRKWGSLGSGSGQFDSPGKIAFCRAAGPNQGLYVLDGGNSRVLKFSSQGDFLAAWQPSNYPKAIAANNSGVYGLRSISQTGYIDVYRKD